MHGSLYQLISMMAVQHVYYLATLLYIRAIPQTQIVLGWCSFAVYFVVCYYNIGLVTLPSYFSMNSAGWGVIAALMFQLLNDFRINRKRRSHSASNEYFTSQNCDCLFRSLSLTIWGNSDNHKLMRYWIQNQLKSFPETYNVIGP